MGHVVRVLLAVVAIILAVPAGGFAGESAFDPTSFDVGLEPVADGLADPLLVTHAGDDRLFVVERGGTIRIIQDGEVLDPPFLDLTDRVGAGASEQGLLGLAFPQDYAETGLFYVDYTDRNGDTVVSRFHAPDNGAIASPESEQVILTQEQPQRNHNGGMLAFGPDNYLYIAFGDGGGQGDPNGNAQRLDTWLGKILRIEVDPTYTNGEHYVVPEDNPFVDDPDARPEIWVYGLRNPWRFSFDSETGDLWIADVGGSAYEEINVVGVDEGGANLGWSEVEGPDCHGGRDCDPADFHGPVFSYTHDVGGCSVTGGYVYRGEEFAELDGVYVFSDYCSGLVWGGGVGADGELVFSEPVETGFRVTSFGEGVDGRLYLTDFDAGGVYELVPPL